MRIILSVCFLCGLVCSASAKILSEKKNYQVETVTRVISPLEFECQLKNFSYSKSARFKVTIQNLELIQETSSGDQSNQLLETALANADVIELRDINEKNYFRLSADVWVDGNDLAPAYARANVAKLIAPPKKQPVVSKKNSSLVSKPTPSRKRTSAYLLSKPAALPLTTNWVSRPSGQYVSNEQLLETAVDLSKYNSGRNTSSGTHRSGSYGTSR